MCSRSSCAASWQADPGLFFEPIEFHLESTDFSVQSIGCAVRRNGLGAAFAFEQGLGLGLNLALPLAHLDWVGAELLRYLIDCLDSSHRLKTHLGFEFRQVCVALLPFTHDLPVSLDSVPLNHLSQIRGPLQDVKMQSAQNNTLLLMIAADRFGQANTGGWPRKVKAFEAM